MTKRSKLTIPGIYTITHIASQKKYVGQSINIRRRWEAHRFYLNKCAHKNAHLQNAWKKYGSEAFIFQIVVDLSSVPEDQLLKELNAAEIRILDLVPEAYNLMEAAKSGTVPSAETRKKLSGIRKEMWENPEFRERRKINHQIACADPELQKRRSASLKEAFSTPEQKAQRAAITKQRWQDPEFKAAMAAKRKANWQDPVYRAQQSEARKAAWVKRKAKKAKV